MLKKNCLMLEEIYPLTLPLVEELSDEAASMLSGGRYKKPFIDTPRRERTGILGSQSKHNLAGLLQRD